MERRSEIAVRAYRQDDVPEMTRVWNEVVEDGVAFPQTEPLGAAQGAEFFAAQTHCGVAVDGDGRVEGMYIMHPNNVGRCGHIANASYAVERECRGRHVGEALVADSLSAAKAMGFRVMQFNAVVAGNIYARRLYEKLGFTQLGEIPGGFLMPDGRYEAICPYYKEL